MPDEHCEMGEHDWQLSDATEQTAECAQPECDATGNVENP